MRYLFGFLCVWALGVVPLAGCGDTAGDGFLCTEQGIRDAIAPGGGPHAFACDGPKTVVTEAEIAIDNDVILDGEGNLTVDGNLDHRVFLVPQGVTTELRGFVVTEGLVCPSGAGIENGGNLTLTNTTLPVSIDRMR